MPFHYLVVYKTFANCSAFSFPTCKFVMVVLIPFAICSLKTVKAIDPKEVKRFPPPPIESINLEAKVTTSANAFIKG
jgi:hypothetical protein